MYGDFEGIVGASLPGLKALELPGAGEEEAAAEAIEEGLFE